MMPTETSPRANVLLIDDELAICIGVSGLLETVGFAANYALDADEGMRYLEAHPETDIVLLDFNLGAGRTGIELLPEIREHFKCVQVMMFTSHNTLSTGLECMKKGAADYLTKPFDEKDFLKKVPEVIAKKNMARLNELYFGILIHDLKNPLQCISGAWELAKRVFPKELSEQQRRIVSIGDSGILQLEVMIHNMLSVSKFEAGSFPVSREEFAVAEEADKVLGPLRTQTIAAGSLFEVEFECGTDIQLDSDRELFSRVLFNVVSNATRYTPEAGKISVGFAIEDNGDLRTSVCNTGSFIEESLREKIFDKFSSIHLMKRAAGTSNFGLGLTFSKMAVHALGGVIRVESENNTPSTTFIFTIKNNASRTALSS